MLKRFLLAAAALTTACVSNQKDFSDVVSHEDFAKAPEKKVDVPTLAYETPYAVGQKSYVSQWVGCKSSANARSFALVSDGVKAFGVGDFCAGPVAQAYLTHGYNLIGINLPGFGSSTGDADLGGPLSVAAVQAVLKDSRTSLYQPIVGLHGTYVGAIAAARAAKGEKGIAMLVLESGILDMEQTAEKTSDAKLKEEAAKIKDEDGFFEKRSVAWDLEGLPPIIAIVHGEADTRVPVDQARSFRDALATQEKRVSLVIVEKAGAEIPDEQRAGALRKVLSEISPSTGSSKP